jgi:hypothetical protein
MQIRFKVQKAKTMGHYTEKQMRIFVTVVLDRVIWHRVSNGVV